MRRGLSVVSPAHLRGEQDAGSEAEAFSVLFPAFLVLLRVAIERYFIGFCYGQGSWRPWAKGEAGESCECRSTLKYLCTPTRVL